MRGQITMNDADNTTPDDAEKPAFKRVMLKISGEALMGDQGYGLHPPTVEIGRAHV